MDRTPNTNASTRSFDRIRSTVARVALAGAAAAVLAGAVAAQTTPRAATTNASIVVPAPRAVLLSPLVDLGTASPGAVVPGRIVLANTSGAPVRIEGAKGGCGCIKLTGFEPFTLGAAQAASVAFTIQAPKTPGEKTKPIVFALGEGTTIETNVHIASIEPVAATSAATSGDAAPTTTAISPTTLVAVPDALDVGVLPVGTSVERTVWLANTGNAPVSVSAITGSCKCLAVADGAAPALASIAPGAAVPVTFHLEAPTQAGRTKTVTLTVATADGHTVQVPIHCIASDAS